MNITQERRQYHIMIQRFRRHLTGGILYDIGGSNRHNYKDDFIEFDYKIIDRCLNKKADLYIDVENYTGRIPKADAILCNGVSEQCDEFPKVIGFIKRAIKPDGTVLFGVCSVGYPLYDTDYVRYTPIGLNRLLTREGFNILEQEIVRREGRPSYIFSICKLAQS